MSSRPLDVLDLIRTGQRDLVDAGGVRSVLYEEASELRVRVTLESDELTK